jgi:hypothetical protein
MSKLGNTPHSPTCQSPARADRAGLLPLSAVSRRAVRAASQLQDLRPVASLVATPRALVPPPLPRALVH